MSLQQQQIAIAADAFSEDVLLLNNVPYVADERQAVKMALVASATGLFIDVLVGTRDIAQNFAPSLANRFPINPDDFNIPAFGMMPGNRLKIRVRNSTGGILQLFFAILAEPV